MAGGGSADNQNAQENHILLTLTGDEDSEAHRTFVFNDEGHTLGNALRSIISRYPNVEFCGYTVPHPAECKMNLRIQTTGVPAVDILKQALQDLMAMCDYTIKTFETKVEEFQAAER